LLLLLSIIFQLGKNRPQKITQEVIDLSKPAPETPTSTNVNLALVTSTEAIPSTTDIMTREEMQKAGVYHRAIYEVTRDKDGKITSAKLIGLTDPQPLKFDTMTAAEREAKGMPANVKIQVLERDSSGKILKYRVMKDDNDIMKMY